MGAKINFYLIMAVLLLVFLLLLQALSSYKNNSPTTIKASADLDDTNSVEVCIMLPEGSAPPPGFEKVSSLPNNSVGLLASAQKTIAQIPQDPTKYAEDLLKKALEEASKKPPLTPKPGFFGTFGKWCGRLFYPLYAYSQVERLDEYKKERPDVVIDGYLYMLDRCIKDKDENCSIILDGHLGLPIEYSMRFTYLFKEPDQFTAKELLERMLFYSLKGNMGLRIFPANPKLRGALDRAFRTLDFDGDGIPDNLGTEDVEDKLRRMRERALAGNSDISRIKNEELRRVAEEARQREQKEFDERRKRVGEARRRPIEDLSDDPDWTHDGRVTSYRHTGSRAHSIPYQPPAPQPRELTDNERRELQEYIEKKEKELAETTDGYTRGLLQRLIEAAKKTLEENSTTAPLP